MDFFNIHEIQQMQLVFMQPAGMILLAKREKCSVGEGEFSGSVELYFYGKFGAYLRDTDRVCHKNRKLHNGKIGPLKIDRYCPLVM